MNVFFTDGCPKVAASHLCKIHRNKMIIEAAQLLSTAHHVLGSDLDAGSIYKKTHENHPSAKWVRESSANYKWVADWAIELCNLYHAETGKFHKTDSVLFHLVQGPLPKFASKEFTQPPFVGDDDLKHLHVVDAYKALIARKYAEWQSREKPLKVEFFTMDSLPDPLAMPENVTKPTSIVNENHKFNVYEVVDYMGNFLIFLLRDDDRITFLLSKKINTQWFIDELTRELFEELSDIGCSIDGWIGDKDQVKTIGLNLSRYQVWDLLLKPCK